MNADLQALLALVVVAIAATALVVRLIRKRKNPGCGGECACPTDDLKSRVRRNAD